MSDWDQTVTSQQLRERWPEGEWYYRPTPKLRKPAEYVYFVNRNSTDPEEYIGAALVNKVTTTDGDKPCQIVFWPGNVAVLDIEPLGNEDVFDA